MLLLPGLVLAWDGRPIFNAEIQAWANGPVVRELYNQHRGHFEVDANSIVGNAQALTRDEKDTVDAVLLAYGHLNGQQLSDLTHSERPWLEARGDLAAGKRCETPIDLDTMQDFFGGLDSAQAN